MDTAAPTPIPEDELHSVSMAEVESQSDFRFPGQDIDDGSTGLLLSEAEARHRALPMNHPDRKPFQFNVLGAIDHFLAFKKDKEQTREVFHIFECLPWRTVDRTAEAFLATPHGQAIYASERFLPEILDDHDALRRLPKGSFAHEYCDYMEFEGLSAAGLVAEYEEFRGDRVRLDDRVEWYVDRLRDTHDLLHILTGFGRDTLGEQCLLTFVYKQRPSPGHLFLGWAGAAVMRTGVRTRAPVIRAVREAQVIGQGSLRIAEQSVLELLAMPTDAVRQRLGIRPAHFYHEAHRIWAEEGINPHDVLAKKAKQPEPSLI